MSDNKFICPQFSIWRGLILGILVVFFINLFQPYARYIICSFPIVHSHYPIILFTIFIFLTVVGTLVARLFGRLWIIPPAEIIIILAIGFVGSAIPVLVSGFRK